MKINNVKQKSSLVSWVIFLATLVIVLISLVSVVFPALLLRTFGGFSDNVGINSFETGVLAYPLLAANFVVFGLTILYFKNKLPQIITRSIRFIFNFEVSPHVAFIVITILIGIYIVFSVGQLFNGKYDYDYIIRVKSWIEDFHFTKIGDEGISEHFMVFLEYTSTKIFGNDKIIPYIGSIALPVLTYFVTMEMTKKRFAGIVALVIVLQSGIFYEFVTSVAYPDFWILFYLFSLYLIYKRWSLLSPISYVLSVLSKSLTAAFLPMTLFFIYRAVIPRKKKIRIVISYAVLAIAGSVFLTSTGNQLARAVWRFNSHGFWGGFSAFQASFRFDELVLIFLLPLVIGLFIASRRGVLQADSILFLIVGMLIFPPFWLSFSEGINVPYRFLPLVVFFAMGVGMLLSKKASQSPELSSSTRK